MADTVVATYGASGYNTPGFTYCGHRPASGSGTDPPPDGDLIRVWLNQCSSFDVDVAHVTVEGSSDDGDPADQYVWVAEPGGTHITHYGDTDGGSGDLSIPTPFGFPGYYNIRVASRADLDYCVTVTFTYCDPDLPLPADHLVVDAPPTAYLGEPFDFTVTALDGADVLDTAYAGTDTFTSDEGGAALPADSPLTSGVGTFPATLNAVGTWTITATDTVDGSITGTSGPIVVTARPSAGCTVWAIRGDATAEGDLNWAGDGSSTSGLIFPPDTDSWDATDVGVTPAWHAGGSDGTFNYHVAIDSAGQWWVAKFDAAMATLLDRWEVTGWVSNNRDTGSPADTWEPELPTQHVTANASNVVVIGHRWEYDAGLDDYVPAAIETTVFDLTGTILDQWSYATPITAGDYDRIDQLSGSCLDATSLYFAMFDYNSNDFICSIDLATGTLTKLFDISNDVDVAITAIDPSWAYPQGLRAPRGIVEIDGDLIVAGYNGIARIQQDGTPVWWVPTSGASGDHFAGLAHSGNGSVWACTENADAHELDEAAGAFIQTITLIEYAQQAWLGACAASDWHVGGAFW